MDGTTTLDRPAAADATRVRMAVVAAEGEVRIESRPLPEPADGEIRLRLRCAGLCGTDLWKLRHRTAPLGTVLGHELVGTVEALGPGVVGFDLGDRVVAPHHVACGVCAFCRAGSEPMCPAFRDNQLQPGAFSESLILGERVVRLATFGLPPSLSDEAAVFLEPAACVLRGVRRVPDLTTASPDRRTVAVLGAGSMGLLHLLVLKAVLPACRVILIDPHADRRALALTLGADAVAAPGSEAREAVAALSERRGAEAVFDTVGGAAALEAALTLGCPGGTVILFAHAEPTEPEAARGAPAAAGFDLNAFFKSERRLIATYSSGLAEQRETFRLLVSGRLDPSPIVTHRLPLSRFAEAVALTRSHRALKVLLVPEGAPA